MPKKLLLMIGCVILLTSICSADERGVHKMKIEKEITVQSDWFNRLKLWKISAYCACVECCGKSDGITASGKKAHYGMVAGNWLEFGTKVRIEGLGVFVVADRGAKSLFGSKTNHIKHLDVYMDSHSEARKFGVKYLEVNVLSKGEKNAI